MHYNARKVKGSFLLEVMIYILVVSVLIGIILGLFLVAKKTMSNQAKIQRRIDVLWKAFGLLDYLQASESNLLTPLQRIYYTGEYEIIIPVVSPYDSPIPSLDAAEDGFYAGDCGSDDKFAIFKVEGGQKEKIEGQDCTPSVFYRLGHSGIPSYAKLINDNGQIILQEAIGTRLFTTEIEEGQISITMLDGSGNPVDNSRKATYIEIKINGKIVPVEISTWREE